MTTHQPNSSQAWANAWDTMPTSSLSIREKRPGGLAAESVLQRFMLAYRIRHPECPLTSEDIAQPYILALKDGKPQYGKTGTVRRKLRKGVSDFLAIAKQSISNGMDAFVQGVQSTNPEDFSKHLAEVQTLRHRLEMLEAQVLHPAQATRASSEREMAQSA